MTRLGIGWQATWLRFEAVGTLTPSGYTVTKPLAVGWVTVTFNTTAPTPDAGTPPAPSTDKSTELPAPTGPAGPPVPLRVSRIRAGVNGVRPPAAALPDANQPD